jgi:large subunit ribosomal protein L25
MKSIEINAKLREKVGKKESNKLRRAEMIPCVLYGTEKNIHFTAEASQFRTLIYTPNVYYAKIMIDGQEHKAVVKEIQFHPVSDKIIHIDFLNIYDDKPITVSVPVRMEGFAQGVQDGGKLYQDVRRLKIKGLLKDFMEEIVIDVTPLTIGKSVKVSDLKFNNLIVDEHPNQNVASCKVTRVVKEAEAEVVEGAEGAAPAEGAAAEGGKVEGKTEGKAEGKAEGKKEK